MTYTNPQSGSLSLGFAASSDGVAFTYLTVPYLLEARAWQHVAVAYHASTGEADFFVNGKSIGSAGGGPHTLFDANTAVSVGRFGQISTVATYWDGSLDEVRIWNVARDATQIDALRSVEVLGDEDGLVAAWHFDGNYADATANAITLSPSNSPTFSSDVPF